MYILLRSKQTNKREKKKPERRKSKYLSAISNHIEGHFMAYNGHDIRLTCLRLICYTIRNMLLCQYIDMINLIRCHRMFDIM